MTDQTQGLYDSVNRDLNQQLVDAVLAWWEENKNNCFQTIPDDDGYSEDRDIYKEEPEFVKLAKRIKG